MLFSCIFFVAMKMTSLTLFGPGKISNALWVTWKNVINLGENKNHFKVNVQCWKDITNWFDDTFFLFILNDLIIISKLWLIFLEPRAIWHCAFQIRFWCRLANKFARIANRLWIIMWFSKMCTVFSIIRLYRSPFLAPANHVFPIYYNFSWDLR